MKKPLISLMLFEMDTNVPRVDSLVILKRNC